MKSDDARPLQRYADTPKGQRVAADRIISPWRSPSSSPYISDKYSDDGSSDKYDKSDDSDDDVGPRYDREGDGLLGQEARRKNAPKDALPIDEDERACSAHALQNIFSPPKTLKNGKKQKPKPVSWSSLPKKGQLAILTLARLSEPLTQTSLQSYMFYQLKSFSPDAPDSTISFQAGVLQAAFTGAQFCTAILWGRLADSDSFGRKKVILIGLAGTAVGAVGFGFSSSFATAVCWRIAGGALNGNIGVMRTMISEIIKEKRFQSRAFLLMPMTFNIGVIIGPILGGLLANPVASYPKLFGKQSVFGGENGVWWMQTWPYALPNIVSAIFLTCSTLAILLGMEETLETLRGKPDIGLRIGRFLGRLFIRRPAQPEGSDHQSIALIDRSPAHSDDLERQPRMVDVPIKPRQKLPFRRIWTWNVLAMLLAHGMLAFHVGTFNNLWFVFLSTPRFNPTTTPAAAANGTDSNDSLQLSPSYTPSLPFKFTGGLGLPPPTIGTALAVLGTIGITLQLFLYPPVDFHLGRLRSYRLSLWLFPIAYLLVPYLATIPTTSLPPLPASGPLFWLALILILTIQVLGRTFALPATTILVNNASPHPSVLGSVHGIGQSASSAMRTLGPLVGGYTYGRGLRAGYVGLVWWGMALWAVVGAVAGCFVRDGDGHEIWLEGEREEAEEEERRKKGEEY